MSGLGPLLYVPHGATAAWLLTFARAEDGAAIDLTGATAIEFCFKRFADADAEDAYLTLDLVAGLTVVDAVAGLVRAALTAAQCATLPAYGRGFYFARATLADGSVVIPDLLRGAFTCALDATAEQQCDGAAITRLDAATGELTPVTPAMSNYTINRHDLTGLTGGTATDLDGLSAVTLAALVSGAIVELFFTGSISARFRLRANAGSETDDAPWKIVADNDPDDRVWELIGVFKQGAPCVWNPDTEKFHQVLASGTGTGVGPALAQEADAFSLPL